MGRWVRVAALADLPPGSAKAVSADGRWYAVFHDPERGFFATDDACPHEDASLGEGAYHDGRVICRQHDWVFDVQTGRCLNAPGVRLACYATRSAGDGLEIELD